MRCLSSFCFALSAMCMLPAVAASKFIDGVTEDAGWYDVNKRYMWTIETGDYNGVYHEDIVQQDNSMCWAATAANTLQWWQDRVKWTPSGTPNGPSSSASANPNISQLAIYSTFTHNWSNAGGRVEVAWNWWFNGSDYSLPADAFSSNSTTSAAGGYWKELGMMPVYEGGVYVDSPLFTTTNFYQEADKETVYATITKFVDDNCAVALRVLEQGGHAISMWGYDYDADGSLILYLTDSDDFANRLFKQKVLVDDELNVYLTGVDGEVGAYETEYSVSLNGTVQTIKGCVLDRITGLTDPTPFMIVPEPSSALLCVLGLTGGLLRRRRR